MIHKARVALLLMFMTTGLAATTDWESLPEAPAGIGNFAIGTFGDDLIIAGGITWRDATRVWLDNVWRFDTKKRTWSESGKLPHPVAYAAHGQTEEGVFLAGGSDGSRTLPESGWLDRQGRWRKAGVVQQPLVYSGSCIAGQKLYVVAGATDAADLGAATNLFYALDLKNGHVEHLGKFPGGKLVLPAVAALENRICVFGGAICNPGENRPLNVDLAWVYSIAKAEWSILKPFPFPARGLAQCGLDEHHILLAGGFREQFTDEAFIYDTRTGNYSRTIPLPIRAMTVLVKCGSDVYCVGGEDRMNHRSALLFKVPEHKLLAAAGIR